MLTAILRKVSHAEEVTLTLSNANGLPLFASMTRTYPSVEAAQAAVADEEFEWHEPTPFSDENVLLIGKKAIGS